MKDISKIRPFTGYPELEGKLITVLCEQPPDFETADELIRLGADVNVEGDDPECNLLSEIIQSRPDNTYKLVKCKRSERCREIECSECEQGYLWDEADELVSAGTIAAIEYFLNNGFEVRKKDDAYGAQCLWALTLAMPSKYLIDATQILFDAGAQNKSIDPRDQDSTAWSFIETEGSYQGTCHANHHLENVYEAAWEMYYNREQGRPYDGIGTYEEAIGKTVTRVLADKPESDNVFFSQNLPNSQHGNCFNNNLYFILDNGTLIITEYAEFWTDSNAPYTETVDVSSRFRKIIGSSIEKIEFSHRSVRKGSTSYGQPITRLVMSNGRQVRFSINFGDVEQKDRAAYYNIILKGAAYE